MLRITYYFHVSDEVVNLSVRSSENAKHTLSVEVSEDDSIEERNRKLEDFGLKCSRLKNALCFIYPNVSVTKVRTEINNYFRKKL